MALPTARQVIDSVEHEAIDNVKTTRDDHIVKFIDGSYIIAEHYTKGEVPEYYPYYPEVIDDDSEYWEEPAGYNWVYVKEDEDVRDGYADTDTDDNPAALKGAIIRAADDALERNPWPHTQVLTATIVSEHGDSATVSWIPEEVTGYDEAKENAGMREWAWDNEDETPVYWKLNPATHTYELEERVVQVTGTTQLTLLAHKVSNEAELEPGTYFIQP